MKFNKLFALLLASTLFVGCSDDDSDWNNSDATVSMGQAAIAVKEAKGIFNVPIQVEGTQNGPIQVTVEVAETGSNPAMDDIHYYVTSKTILIPADATSGKIEIMTVDDEDINEPRTFTISIKSAQGAKIGTNSECVVTLKDNDAEFYEKLQGTWTMQATSAFDGSKASWKVKVYGYDEEEEGYNKTLYISGMMGYDWTEAELSYNFDMATNKVSVSFVLGSQFASGVNFGVGEPCNVFLATTTTGEDVNLTGTMGGRCSADLKTITFDEEKILGFFVITASGQGIGYWDAYYDITMSRN